MNESNIPTGSHFELNEMYSDGSAPCISCGCAVHDIEYAECLDCHTKLINQAIANCKKLED